jgi:glycosyltransferase involved in cell wall biosynthesis
VRLLAYTDSGAVGGAELALGYLLGALAPEHAVTVASTDRAVGEAIAAHRAGTEVVALAPPRGAADAAALAEHLRVVRRVRPDVVHANQAWPWACAYGVLAGVLTPGVRVVAVDHLPVDGAIPRLRRFGRRRLAARLDAHVAVGRRAARLVEGFVGLPVGSVRAIPNGVPPPVAAPRLVPRLIAGPVIGSLGRLTAQKGYDALVRALPSLPGATLVLVGDGEERGALEALAAELGVADRLRITGWTADARRYLPTFDAFALPSLWEGMPLVLLEAMHDGLPVVATDVGSVAEAVTDGETGFVVPAGDEAALRERLARLLGDADLRRRLGARARALAAEEFTAAAMARRYEAVYREVLAGGEPPR